jgi:tetratricopeptide (TPR) repeat protein
MKLAAILAVALASSSAFADEQAEARTLFKEGNRLLDQGDYVGALDMFRGAYSRWPNVKILLNTGTCLRQLGRNVEAAETYEKYLNDSQADAAKKQVVEQILKEISARLGKLRIEVSEPGAKVIVDGKAVGGSPQSFIMRVEPGSHSVVAEKEGYPLAAATVTVGAGEERAVEMRLTGAAPRPETPTPVEKPATPPPTQTPATTESTIGTPAIDSATLAAHGKTKTIAGAALLAVGVAALATGIAFGVLAKNEGDYITNLNNTMQAYSSSHYSAGQTDQIVEEAMIGIGAAAAVAGAVVLVLGRREVSKSRAQVMPTGSAHAAGAAVRFDF